MEHTLEIGVQMANVGGFGGKFLSRIEIVFSEVLTVIRTEKSDRPTGFLAFHDGYAEQRFGI